MTIFLTTDTHFNHTKMLDFCKRPIDYELRILNGFRELLETDTLIHLGDICIGDDIRVHRQYIEPLACKKILVRGNHDHKSNSWYEDHGWDFVCNDFTITHHKVICHFSHRPKPWDGIFNVNFHGHLHNLGHRQNEIGNGMNSLISLERMGYAPISLTSLVGPILSKIIDKE